MSERITIAVGGGTPGADSNDYVLFDSTTAMAPGTIVQTGIKRLSFGVCNDHAGTLKQYASTDKGTNWDLVASVSVPLAAANVFNGPYDFPVDGEQDCRLVWTNGGSAQGTWRTSLAGHTDRARAT